MVKRTETKLEAGEEFTISEDINSDVAEISITPGSESRGGGAHRQIESYDLVIESGDGQGFEEVEGSPVSSTKTDEQIYISQGIESTARVSITNTGEDSGYVVIKIDGADGPVSAPANSNRRILSQKVETLQLGDGPSESSFEGLGGGGGGRELPVNVVEPVTERGMDSVGVGGDMYASLIYVKNTMLGGSLSGLYGNTVSATGTFFKSLSNTTYSQSLTNSPAFTGNVNVEFTTGPVGFKAFGFQSSATTNWNKLTAILTPTTAPPAKVFDSYKTGYSKEYQGQFTNTGTNPGFSISGIIPLTPAVRSQMPNYKNPTRSYLANTFVGFYGDTGVRKAGMRRLAAATSGQFGFDFSFKLTNTNAAGDVYRTGFNSVRLTALDINSLKDKFTPVSYSLL